MARSTTRSPKTPRWLRPPRQRRSDASLQRVLDAAEALMEDKAFSDITVAGIVKQARSPVGVFYSRFPDKLALLHHLDERFAQDVEDAFERRFRIEDWEGRPFGEACDAAVAFLYRLHAAKRGMLRSVILQVRTHPNQRFQQTGRRLVTAIDRLADFLLRWRSEIDHPHPDRAVRLALLMTISVIRDLVVFSDTTFYRDVLGLDPHDTPAALAGAFRNILTTAPGRRS
jgi:AcrR family transcriptional regulator